MQLDSFLLLNFLFLLRIDSENKRYSFLRGTAIATDLLPAGENPSTRHTHTP